MTALHLLHPDIPLILVQVQLKVLCSGWVQKNRSFLKLKSKYIHTFFLVYWKRCQMYFLFYSSINATVVLNVYVCVWFIELKMCSFLYFVFVYIYLEGALCRTPDGIDPFSAYHCPISARDEVYSILFYMIKFVLGLVFSEYTRFLRQ